MPFTGSHPAAVLPLVGRGLPASALVIGSLAPDLPYYIPNAFPSTGTHTLTAVVGVDLMVGLALFLLWHLVLVPPLLWIAPAAVQQRIPDSLRRGGRISSAAGLGLVCAGLVIGSLSHLALDMITHRRMWAVQEIAVLSEPVLGHALHRWLHLLLSIIGLVLIAWFLLRWWRTAPLHGPVAPVAPSLRWGVVCGLLAVACAAGLRGALQAAERLPALSGAVATAGILAFCSALAIGVLVGAVVWHVGAARGTSRGLDGPESSSPGSTPAPANETAGPAEPTASEPPATPAARPPR